MMQHSAIVTEADNGKTIEARRGDALVLRLPENATTGFRWAFDGLDPAAVSVEEGTRARASEKIGSGGEATWTLTPKASGATSIKLKLWRHWEGDSSVRQRFAVTLTVKP